MKFEDKEAAEKLQGVREHLAEEGIELTPDQVVDAITSAEQKLIAATGNSLLDYVDLKRRYDPTPPPPPYDGWWDNEKEVTEFKARAEAEYGCKLKIVPNGKLFQLIETSK